MTGVFAGVTALTLVLLGQSPGVNCNSSKATSPRHPPTDASISTCV